MAEREGAAEKPAEATKKAPSGSPPGSLAMIVVSTFALALIGMMFATGVAQRAALPRVKALFSRFEKKKAPDAAPADSAAVDSSAAAPMHEAGWSPEADSLSVLRQQIETAMTELAESRARFGEEAATGSESASGAEGGIDALADSTARRDLARLVKVLDAMKPADAARVLNSVEDVLAIEAIRRLKERQAGKVLALLAPAKAATVSLALGRGAEMPR